ncbi:MAG: hypothetical protein WAK48_25555 [Candidatus Acidiferrum sp.]
MRAGVWNVGVLLGGLRERNFTGSYRILRDYYDHSAPRVVTKGAYPQGLRSA